MIAGMEKLDTVKLALPVPPTADTDEAVVVVVLRGNPYSGEAAGRGRRRSANACTTIAPGGLLGGIPAENYDIEQTNARDTKLIVPLVLLVVGLILAAVLRALVAPAYLIAHRRRLLRGDARPLHLRLLRVSAAKGIAFNLVLLSFIFLVALGVDYNIFLMTRAREEAAVRGTREGVLRRPRQHRRRRHRRRPDPRRHLRHPDPAAARGAGPDRRHRRDRRPARHLRRPRPADPGDHLPARRARLVAAGRAATSDLAGADASSSCARRGGRRPSSPASRRRRRCRRRGGRPARG